MEILPDGLFLQNNISDKKEHSIINFHANALLSHMNILVYVVFDEG